MKQYFIDKLKKLKEAIESTEKSIIKAATGLSETGSITVLVNNGKSLLELKDKFNELQKDCMTYCTVDEVIEIASVKNWYGDITLNLIEYRNAEYHYQYNSKGILYFEREKLKQCFGRSFNEAKIK